MTGVLDFGAYDIMNLGHVGVCVQQAIARSREKLRDTDPNRAEALAAVSSTLQTSWRRLDSETLRSLLRNADLDERATEECGSILTAELGPVVLEEVERLETSSEHGPSWILDPGLKQLLGDWQGITEQNDEAVRALALSMRGGCERTLRADPRRFALILEDISVGFSPLGWELVDVLFDPLRDAVRKGPPEFAATMLRRVYDSWNREVHTRLCRELKDDLIRLLQSASASVVAELVYGMSQDVAEEVVRASVGPLAEKVRNEPVASVARLVSSLPLARSVGSEIVYRSRADLTSRLATATPEERAGLLLAIGGANRDVARGIARDLRGKLEADLRQAQPATVVRTFIAVGRADPELALSPKWLRLGARAFRECPREVRDKLLVELANAGEVVVQFLDSVRPGLADYVFGRKRTP